MMYLEGHALGRCSHTGSTGILPVHAANRQDACSPSALLLKPAHEDIIDWNKLSLPPDALHGCNKDRQVVAPGVGNDGLPILRAKRVNGADQRRDVT